MGTFLKPEDLANFAEIVEGKANDMIQDAESQAFLIAPCIADLDPETDALKFKAVKAILRSAILRWNDAGNGAKTTTQQGAGPYQQMTVVDNTKTRIGAFWPSEIERLQNICKADDSKGVFSIDTAPSVSSTHLAWCNLNFGASYCSCGVDIAGYPIYETD